MSEENAILLIYTGGTIGMVKDSETGSLYPLDFDQLYQYIPVLEGFNFKIDNVSFNPVIDSSDMNPAFWLELAGIIEQNYNQYDGFVILHGSDTMAYTASVLSFMLENLNKPVVLTGSQLPLGMLRTDGRENLITAIEIAASQHNGVPRVPEVSICFESKLYRGNRTTKFNAENFDAFYSGNYPLLAEAGVNMRFFQGNIREWNDKPLKVHKKLDNNIGALKLFPGISPNLVRSILGTKGMKALILQTFGSGNAPTDQWFLDALKEACDRGVIILNVTQCKAGSVQAGRYETSRKLVEMGVISGYDITTESAISKLMFLLGTEEDYEVIKQKLGRSLRGEMTIS